LNKNETELEATKIVIGGIDRWNRSKTPNLCPGLTLHTTTVLAALISLAERSSTPIITYNQLFRALGSLSCCSAHHRETLKSALATLESIDISIQAANMEIPKYEKLLALEPCQTRPVFGKTAPAFRINFSPTFMDVISNAKYSAPVHLESLCSVRSRMARTLYLILTTWAQYSRAHASHPFRISFSKLLTHLGQPIPTFRSSRRAIFKGHRRQSVFDEINGKTTPYGILNLSITDSTSFDDDCVSAWISPSAALSKPLETTVNELSDISHNLGETTRVNTASETDHARAHIRNSGHTQERTSISPDSLNQYGLEPSVPSWTIKTENRPAAVCARQLSHEKSNEPNMASPINDISTIRHLKIYQAWNASGRNDGEFIQRIRNQNINLSRNDMETLKTARISPTSCENFPLMAKKLLPERTWMDILGEAKYAALSQTPPKSPTGKLISEMLSALRGSL